MNYWELKIRVNNKVITTNVYRSRRWAKQMLGIIISRGLNVYSEDKKLPEKFSWSLLKREGRMPTHPPYNSTKK